MIHLENLRDGLDIFKALGSDIRLEIMALLSKQDSLNMNDIATHLGLTNGALTSHIKKLEDCNLIKITSATGKKGTQKICSIRHSTLVASLQQREQKRSVHEFEINPGSYFDFSVTPTCGIATKDHIIGALDDPRFFSHPDRINSGILWLTSGYVEYRVPNFLTQSQEVKEMRISFEVSSEAPGINNDWPSDIHFWVNGVCLGFWTCPGDFSDMRGILNPSWWSRDLNQHGLLKILSIRQDGCYIDGLKISDISLSNLDLPQKKDISLRFGVPGDANNCGGMTLYGRSFGNYNQGIQVEMFW